MRNKNYILILFVPVMLLTNTLFAQMDSIAKAGWILMDSTLTPEVRTKRAMVLVNKSMSHLDANSAYAWYTKGIIYKEWYKLFEKQDKKSKARLDAVEFLKTAIVMDTSNGQPITIKAIIEYNGNTYITTDVYNVANVKLVLTYLGSTFQNDAAELMPEGLLTIDTSSINIAIQNYKIFKECMIAADPVYNLIPWEINFKTVLADQYGKIFLSDIETNLPFYGMAEDLYKRVIALDTNNWAGNYNLAMLYYNYGVNIINAMAVNMETIPLTAVDQIQEQAIEQFKKSLPYALKAYELNSKRMQVLRALEGIYTVLYEEEKVVEFKAKAALLEREK